MAWNPPTDTELGPEKPGLSSVFIRMRDMLASAFAADSGAPKLVNAALNGYPWDANSSDVANAGWVLIESWTPTAVNSKDFTWDETAYSDIMIVVESVSPATDGQPLYGYLGYSDGTSFFAGSGDYSLYLRGWVGSTFGEVTSENSETAIYLTYSVTGVFANGVGSAAGEGYSATILLQNLGSTKSNPTFEYQSSYRDNAGTRFYVKGDGHVNDTASTGNKMDSFRLAWASGNFYADGKIYVYGLKRA